MSSTTDWTESAQPLQQAEGSIPHRSRHSLRTFLATIANALRRTGGRRDGVAPAAPKSLIYALCTQYQQPEFWKDYYAFRIDPRASNWDRLRRRSVSWRSEETVEALLQRQCPLTGKRMPDPVTLEFALVTTSFVALEQSNKARARADAAMSTQRRSALRRA